MGSRQRSYKEKRKYLAKAGIPDGNPSAFFNKRKAKGPLQLAKPQEPKEHE